MYGKQNSIPSFVQEAAEAGIISIEQAAEMLEFSKRRRLNL
jgi:hypothetical protein